MQLEKLSATQLGEMVNRREISAVDVIKYFQSRVEELNSGVNAIVYTKFDEAIQVAEKIDDTLDKGEYVGPLAGVPVVLKDFLPSKKGWTNSHGGVKSLIMDDDHDSTFYSAVKALGAIAIGKSNAPAFGFSGACENKLYGATCNPFDTSRTSGGSSGGSAAAVAKGLALAGEGGDAGGSIRIPAGWCNLFGFKPSLGTVPSYCRPDGWSATHPYCFSGPIVKTVKDAAVIMNQMARYDPKDPISLPINANKDFTELMKSSIKGKKIAFTYDFDLYNTDSEVKEIINSTVLKLIDAGAEVHQVSFNFQHTLEDMVYCWAWSISLDTSLDIQKWKSQGLDLINDHSDELPEEFIHFNEVASNVGLSDMRTFNEIRTDILDNFERIFAEYDAILAPVCRCNPIKHSDIVRGQEAIDTLDFIKFAETFLVNFIGYPAASVPAGLTKSNLPAGVQIIGRQYKDEDVFAISHTLEQVQPWNQYYDMVQ